MQAITKKKLNDNQDVFMDPWGCNTYSVTALVGDGDNSYYVLRTYQY